MPTIHFKLKFDTIPTQRETLVVRYDALPSLVNATMLPGKLDARPLQPLLSRNHFDSFRSGDVPQVFANRFTAAARRTFLTYNRLNVVRIGNTTAIYGNRFDARSLNSLWIPVSWDSLNDFPDKITRYSFSYESKWAYLWKNCNRFQVVSDVVARISYGRFPVKFHVGRTGNGCFPVRFDSIPQDFIAYYRNRYDAVGTGFAAYPARKQAFVCPGWRIISKNIESGEVIDLGFIDAESENPVLENVFLLDGDYEISILTSSLFWKDTLDSIIRTISIRPGEEISTLPTIYNLRSSISQGETTIHWSANRSEVTDCVFGVWYSSASPVPTDGPPDSVVWYSPDLTEYQTSFSQKAACYIAVAAMRTGDIPELGPVKELFLAWSSTKPRYPDDVVIFDKPLPVIDPHIQEIEQENPDLSLWG